LEKIIDKNLNLQYNINMNEKVKFMIIKILKISAIIFLISAVGSFITTVIYNIINAENTENLFIYIFANLGVTLFYRIVIAVFFFVFAMFMDEWLKVDEKE